MKSKPAPRGWRLLRGNEKPRLGDRFDFFGSERIQDFAGMHATSEWHPFTLGEIRGKYNAPELRIVRRISKKKKAAK